VVTKAVKEFMGKHSYKSWHGNGCTTFHWWSSKEYSAIST